MNHVRAPDAAATASRHCYTEGLLMADNTSVLIVDDEPDNCASLCDILQDFGYDVETATNGETALELIRNRSFDVALLDLRMPGMNGLELYREIRRLRPETVAIVLTAYASTDMARQIQTAGAWRILSKPLNVSGLFPLIDEAASQPLLMVVDDDHDLCASLWDVLREHGYRVSLAHSQGEARERLVDGRFRIILLDLKLPDGHGGSIMRLVRETSPDSRVVLISGYRDEAEEMLGEVTAEEPDAVCFKPFEVPDLLQKIQTLTGNVLR